MKRLLKLFAVTFIFLFTLLPILASNDEYVRDDYGVISQEEVQTLNALAKEYSEVNDVGIYIRVFKETDNTFDLAAYAEEVYASEGLGNKTNGNMILLILDMENREYQYVAHGDKANAAFTDYGKVQLDDYVLVHLKNDQYYEAFNQFIMKADEYLDLYEQGEPVDVHNDPVNQNTSNALRTGATFGLPPLLALLTCLGLKSRNNSVHRATDADDFIPKNGVNILVRQDSFLYSNETRVVHSDPPSHSSGGTTINSGGFSSHGGKF